MQQFICVRTALYKFPCCEAYVPLGTDHGSNSWIILSNRMTAKRRALNPAIQASVSTKKTMRLRHPPRLDRADLMSARLLWTSAISVTQTATLQQHGIYSELRNWWRIHFLLYRVIMWLKHISLICFRFLCPKRKLYSGTWAQSFYNVINDCFLSAITVLYNCVLVLHKSRFTSPGTTSEHNM